jgi:Fur family ferric uptake transcriptional regulator
MTNKDEFLAELRVRMPNARITAQRRLVIDVMLADPNGHYTCEDVAKAVAARGVKLDLSTVYRILQWLKGAGVVSQTDLGLGSDVYSLVTSRTHHHLVCLECGQITDIDDSIFAGLRRALQLAYHFTPRIEHFAIFGYCHDCMPFEAEDLEE